MKVLELEKIRASERAAVESGKTTYLQLMKNAGTLIAKRIAERGSVAGKRICVVCGKGNNGGDGLVVAGELSARGAFVSLVLPSGVPSADTAARFSNIAEKLPVVKFVPESCDILIDALLGIGIDRPVGGVYADIIRSMNNCHAFKVAVDIPSGLFCDSGAVETEAFNADVTYTVIAAKQCFFLPPAGEYCGKIEVLDIGAPPAVGDIFTIDGHSSVKRGKYSHKGTFGTALLVCGSYGMCGAGILAARAALRSGVGIVRALVCDKNYAPFCSAVPEAVTIPVPTSLAGVPVADDSTVFDAVKGADAVLFGCGISCGAESERLFRRIAAVVSVPIVIDADGINLLCRDISIIRNIKAPIIITPHPGEMARLCNTTVTKIESDRVGYARDFAMSHKCVVVLKGANTVVADTSGKVFFNTTGNAGMATGGSGDVLAGITVSLLAQGRSALEAACDGVFIHGDAADSVREHCSSSALIPSDIIQELKKTEI